MRYGYGAIYLYVQDKSCFIYCASVTAHHYTVEVTLLDVVIDDLWAQTTSLRHS